jgi:hypothetical protein
MDLGGLGWILMDVAGPLLLVAILIWAIVRNRKSRTPRAVTEEGTRRLYEREEQLRKAGRDGEEGTL